MPGTLADSNRPNNLDVSMSGLTEGNGDAKGIESDVKNVLKSVVVVSESVMEIVLD